MRQEHVETAAEVYRRIGVKNSPALRAGSNKLFVKFALEAGRSPAFVSKLRELDQAMSAMPAKMPREKYRAFADRAVALAKSGETLMARGEHPAAVLDAMLKRWNAPDHKQFLSPKTRTLRAGKLPPWYSTKKYSPEEVQELIGNFPPATRRPAPINSGSSLRPTTEELLRLRELAPLEVASFHLTNEALFSRPKPGARIPQKKIGEPEIVIAPPVFENLDDARGKTETPSSVLDDRMTPLGEAAKKLKQTADAVDREDLRRAVSPLLYPHIPSAAYVVPPKETSSAKEVEEPRKPREPNVPKRALARILGNFLDAEDYVTDTFPHREALPARDDEVHEVTDDQIISIKPAERRMENRYTSTHREHDLVLPSHVTLRVEPREKGIADRLWLEVTGQRPKDYPIASMNVSVIQNGTTQLSRKFGGGVVSLKEKFLLPAKKQEVGISPGHAFNIGPNTFILRSINPESVVIAAAKDGPLKGRKFRIPRDRDSTTIATIGSSPTDFIQLKPKPRYLALRNKKQNKQK